jgi:hypothetical protein
MQTGLRVGRTTRNNEATTQERKSRGVFAIIVPLTIAIATILSSTIMTGVSEDAASESHRLEREAIWDIPVMDTLRMWKRSMGTVGSGKLRLENSYENGEIQVCSVHAAGLLPNESNIRRIS